jgi:glucose/arabinose dehydrogenase
MPLVRRGLIATVVLVAAACSPAPSPVPVPSPPAQASTARPSGTPGGTAIVGPSAPAAGSPRASPVTSASAGPFDPAGVVPVVSVVTGGLSSPLDVADAGDGSGRIFVAEQAGRIRIVRDGILVERPFLDITGRIASGGERGLLGIAFHPGYPTDPRVFVDYTDKDGNTVVSSFRVTASDPDAADPASEVVLLHVTQPFPNHNGGGIHFGADGMLYIALGDGGSGGDPQGNGQRLDTLLAKILRIDVDGTSNTGAYAIPPDNPFVATAGAKPEIWQTGLRNPWRFSFDGPTGDLWIGDVGQAAWEEIDVARRGASGLNFGWNVMEGFHCFKPSDGCNRTGLTLPVAEYGHDLGCAVIGGVVVRDARQGRLDGGYLFGDACLDNLWLMDPTGDGRREPVLAERIGRSLSSIDALDDGTVYATALGSGELLRISGPGG